MVTNPMLSVGRPDELEQALGLDPITSMRIAAIVVFAARIEFQVEQVIWKLQGLDPKGVRPKTDAAPISELIKMLTIEGGKQATPAVRELIELWCAAAVPAFECRHNISHGVSVRLGSAINFLRNPRWSGEERKRDPSSLWGGSEELSLIRDAFAVLLRIIAGMSADKPLERLCTPEVTKALRTARSVTGEFSSNHNPSFEKY